jgi:RNA polymerase sigma factor (sigma-70 family)
VGLDPILTNASAEAFLDRALNAAAKAQAPFQRFLDDHREPVLAFLRAMVGHHDAEDCFQETFIAAMRHYERLDGSHPRAWVLAIARNKAIDSHRARARRPEPRDRLPEGADGGEPDHGNPELWAAVAELPPKMRAAVALRFVSELPYREVAAAMECSEEAARRSVHEGLKRLRQTVKPAEREAAA